MTEDDRQDGYEHKPSQQAIGAIVAEGERKLQ